MDKGVQTLSEREKETLRLLLSGHDAKSTARKLGLSVHTVNERLRAARRKLEVSSSREAARILGEAEGGGPKSYGDKDFGVADSAATGRKRQPGAGFPVAWLAGGMLFMSLIIAAAVLSITLQGSGHTSAAEGPATAAQSTQETAASTAAREWALLADQGRWDESWQTASDLFRSQIGAAAWAAAIEPVRKPLGVVSTRTVQSATKANSLPGAPAGEYELVEFRTNFSEKAGAVETVVMVREGGAWKVAGYFIR